MILKEFKKLKSFPKDKAVIHVTKRAMLSIYKTAKPKGGFIYRGTVLFKYINGKVYNSTVAAGSFKKVMNATLIYYEQRNKQMLGYERHGI